MKLLVKDCHNKKRKISEVEMITRDGWVITKDGTYGDVGQDCEFVLELPLLEIRKKAGLLQEEMAWIMGISRASYISKEQGKTALSLIEYLALTKTKELFSHLN